MSPTSDNAQQDQSVRTPYLPPGTVITETDLRSIYIGRLPDNVLDSDLRSLFSGCGEIKRCTIVKNMKSGSSKGVAFIEFGDRSAVTAALALNGTELKGSPLSIVEKRTRQDNTQKNFFQGPAAMGMPMGAPTMATGMHSMPTMMNPAMMMAAPYWPMHPAAMMRSPMMRGGRPPQASSGPMPVRMPRNSAPGRFPSARPMFPPRAPYSNWTNASSADMESSRYEEDDGGLWGSPATDKTHWNNNAEGEWSSDWAQRGRSGGGPAFRGGSRFSSGPVNRPSATAHHPYNGNVAGTAPTRFSAPDANSYW